MKAVFINGKEDIELKEVENIQSHNDEFKVSCYIKDGNDELVNITMYATSKDQARNITKNWNNDAEQIYEKLLEMMTKETSEEQDEN